MCVCVKRLCVCLCEKTACVCVKRLHVCMWGGGGGGGMGLNWKTEQWSKGIGRDEEMKGVDISESWIIIFRSCSYLYSSSEKLSV